MSEGKANTMGQHLACTALIEFLVRNPERLYEFHELGKSGSRVTLDGKNLYQCLKARENAEAAGLPCAIFKDEGHIHPPHFDGSPIIVGVAIGPCTKAEARPFVKKFQSWGR